MLAMFAVLGTAPNGATQKYLNARKVPHLFLVSGATRWNDPKHFPWTIGYLPSYRAEASIYAKYILSLRPNGEIAVLYRNNDLGKDYLRGLHDGLDGRVSMVVAEEPYEVTQPTIEHRQDEVVRCRYLRQLFNTEVCGAGDQEGL